METVYTIQCTLCVERRMKMMLTASLFYLVGAIKINLNKYSTGAWDLTLRNSIQSTPHLNDNFIYLSLSRGANAVFETTNQFLKSVATDLRYSSSFLWNCATSNEKHVTGNVSYSLPNSIHSIHLSVFGFDILYAFKCVVKCISQFDLISTLWYLCVEYSCRWISLQLPGLLLLFLLSANISISI